MSDTLCHHCDCLMLLAMYKSGMEDFEGSMQEFISMKKSLISIVFHIVISIFTFVRHRLLLMLFCIEEHLFCFIGLLEAVFWTLITRVVCHWYWFWQILQTVSFSPVPKLSPAALDKANCSKLVTVNYMRPMKVTSDYMRPVWTQTGMNSDWYGVITWDWYESNKWLHETGMNSDQYDNSKPFVCMLKPKISNRSEISLQLHGKNCGTGLTHSCRFSSWNESNQSEVIFRTSLM